MKIRLTPLAMVIGAAFLPALSHAAGTAAGTNITNTATATFTDPSGTPRTTNSNTSTVQVDEILDVTLVSDDGGNVGVYTPASGQVLTFTVTNTGNGSEKYLLTVQDTLTGDNFDPANVKVYLDDGDGVLETGAGGDTLFVAGSNDPVLAPDSPLKVFVVSDIPGSLADGDIANVKLVATSETVQGYAGTPVAGDFIAGAGTGGSAAVFGTTLGTANVTNGYQVSHVATSFVKTSTVVDPWGGSTNVPGAVITYSLALDLTGSGTVTGAKIVDNIPAGTTYKTGSLKLDGGSLTEGVDSDAGSFDGTKVEVDLGDLVVPASHTVTFDVTITP